MRFAPITIDGGALRKQRLACPSRLRCQRARLRSCRRRIDMELCSWQAWRQVPVGRAGANLLGVQRLERNGCPIPAEPGRHVKIV